MTPKIPDHTGGGAGVTGSKDLALPAVASATWQAAFALLFTEIAAALNEFSVSGRCVQLGNKATGARFQDLGGLGGATVSGALGAFLADDGFLLFVTPVIVEHAGGATGAVHAGITSGGSVFVTEDTPSYDAYLDGVIWFPPYSNTFSLGWAAPTFTT